MSYIKKRMDVLQEIVLEMKPKKTAKKPIKIEEEPAKPNEPKKVVSESDKAGLTKAHPVIISVTHMVEHYPEQAHQIFEMVRLIRESADCRN